MVNSLSNESLIVLKLKLIKKKKKRDEKQTQLYNPLVGCLNILLFNRLSVQVNLNWKLWAERLLSWPGKLAI